MSLTAFCSYKNNIGQRVTLQNFYMTYGGTNWGHSAAPVVYTSYDYRSVYPLSILVYCVLIQIPQCSAPGDSPTMGQAVPDEAGEPFRKLLSGSS